MSTAPLPTVTSASPFIVRNVSFHIEKLIVLKDISFSVSPGERVLLLGANGAGKSTLLRLCAGLIRPFSGSLGRVDAGGTSRPLGAATFGYFGHAPMLYGDLSVVENLRLFSALRGCGLSEVRALRDWGLEPFMDRPARELSQGFRNRLAFVLATLHRPEILLLDEPTTALDEQSCARLLNAAEQASCSIIATHDTHRLLPWATRVLLLNQGVLEADSGAMGSDWRAAVLERYLAVNR